ncbi:MAG: hypothetical protein A07HN63_00699 [uncultured archaeon A07HN63]|nr:MAG: hypothetical protein A07HN63_00699 [uncultured archaeon A07HN63]
MSSPTPVASVAPPHPRVPRPVSTRLSNSHRRKPSPAPASTRCRGWSAPSTPAISAPSTRRCGRPTAPTTSPRSGPTARSPSRWPPPRPRRHAGCATLPASRRRVPRRQLPDPARQRRRWRRTRQGRDRHSGVPRRAGWRAECLRGRLRQRRRPRHDRRYLRRARYRRRQGRRGRVGASDRR